MQVYVYQQRIPNAKGNVLDSIKIAVAKTRDRHPKLQGCSLADVGLERTPEGIDVTLYFQADDTVHGL